MPRPKETIADRIAMDIAMSIHEGTLNPGDRIPTQSELKEQYGVAPQTASTAQGHLSRAGLTQGHPRRGTFVAESSDSDGRSPVLDILDAWSICLSLAYGTFQREESGAYPAALAGLDRNVLRFMADAFQDAAHDTLTGRPRQQVLVAARAVVERGGACDAFPEENHMDRNGH
jgi:DNA-binding GntR family transcriptional regulator